MGGDTALGLLRDEFKGDNLLSKRRASERLDLVAKVIGPEKVRSDLVPWLNENLTQEDEILYIFAKKCTVLLGLLGGAEHSDLLLPVTEKLLAVEETYVREAAVECAQRLVSGLSKDSAKVAVVEMVLRLAKSDWFTSRMSACALCGPLLNIGLGAEDAKRVKEAFFQLGNDETPMVRRAASKDLGDVVRGLNKEEVAEEVMPLFAKRCTDPQESVAVNWIGNLGAICKALREPKIVEEHCLSYMKMFSSDRSWRIRFSMAKQFDEIFAAVTETSACTELLPLYTELLRDVEGDVRKEAAAHLAAVCKTVRAELFVSNVVPTIQSLVENDNFRLVRLAISTALVSEPIISTLGTDMTKQHLLPLWEALLKNSADASAPEIRLILLESLDTMIASLGGSFIARNWAQTLRELFDLSRQHNGGQNDDLINPNNAPSSPEDIEHPQWRLRVVILKALSKLVGSSESSVDELISDLWLSSLADEVCQVRLMAAEILSEFSTPGHAIGADKVLSDYVPKLSNYFKNAKQKYNHRVVFVHAFKSLLTTDAKLAEPLFELYEKCLDDKVANVRIAAAKAAVGVTDENFVARFQKQISALRNDPDSDVCSQAAQVTTV